MENICISLSLLEMTYCSGKNFYLDGMELQFNILIGIAIYYRQTRLAFVVQEDTFYLGILLYKSSARIYLPVTKSVLQVK